MLTSFVYLVMWGLFSDNFYGIHSEWFACIASERNFSELSNITN